MEEKMKVVSCKEKKTGIDGIAKFIRNEDETIKEVLVTIQPKNTEQIKGIVLPDRRQITEAEFARDYQLLKVIEFEEEEKK